MIKSKNIFQAMIIVLLILTVLSYIIPLLYAYFNSDFLLYVNAWDEETYLTYQGAIGTLKIPGYFLFAYITLFFQNIGISGSVENVIFDLFLIPLMIFMLYRIFVNYTDKQFYAFLFAVIVLFSSVLFNYANPLLSNLYPLRDLRFFMFGYENYASLLRTPNPQVSYFLLTVTLYFFQKTKKKILLFLPLPFIYFYVAVPYFYFLFIYVFITFFKKKITIKNLVISSLIAYSIIALGLILMDKLFLENSEIAMNSFVYLKTRQFFFPLNAVVTLVFLLVQYFFYRQQKNEYLLTLVYLQVYLFISFVFMGNFQLISGYLLSYKNYYDYSFSIMIGLSISLFIYSFIQSNIGSKIVNGIIFIFTLAILYCNLTSQGFYFSTMQYKIFTGGSTSQEELQQILSNPTYAIVDDLDYRAKIPYGKAHTIAPPFAYQYIYSFINTQCSYNKTLHNNAIQYINQTQPVKHKIYQKAYMDYMHSMKNSERIQFHNKGYCHKSLYLNSDYFLVDVNTTSIWSFFPRYDDN